MNGRYCETDTLNGKLHWVKGYPEADGDRHLYWAVEPTYGDERWFLDDDTNPDAYLAFVTSSQVTPPLGAATWQEYRSANFCDGSGWGHATLTLSAGI